MARAITRRRPAPSTAELAPNLYAGAWGSTELQAGHHTSAQIGASMTFTTHEKYALTAAGIVDQDGNLETRLQFTC